MGRMPDGSPRSVENGKTPDPEVVAKPKRRRFTAEYKLKVLRDTDAVRDVVGGIGEVLRREGLYSSHLTSWRKERDSGQLAGLTPKKRGRPPKQDKAIVEENRRLGRENARLQQRLAQAEAIIEIQKKVASLLGIPLNAQDSDETDS